jgi:mannose-6-phosphate isomerase-like protein (cupin superfamily)
MAHFQWAPGQVAATVTHRTVEEIWFVVAGSGQMWHKQGQREEITAAVRAGSKAHSGTASTRSQRLPS